MSVDPVQTHDLHRVVEQHGAEISALAEGQKQLGLNLDRVVRTMEQGFAASSVQVDRLGNRLEHDRTTFQTASKTNWPVLFGSISVAMVVLGFYTDSRIKPLDVSLSTVQQGIADIRQGNDTRSIDRYTATMAAADKNTLTAAMASHVASNDSILANIAARFRAQDEVIDRNRENITRNGVVLELLRSGELRLKQAEAGK